MLAQFRKTLASGGGGGGGGDVFFQRDGLSVVSSSTVIRWGERISSSSRNGRRSREEMEVVPRGAAHFAFIRHA